MTISKIPVHGKVAVLGGGISGLAYSYFLKSLRPDLNLTILEKSDRLGGYISTVKLNDSNSHTPISLEKGPRTLRGVSDGTLVIIDILNALNESEQIQVLESSSLANKKYLLSDMNKIVQVPTSLTSFWSFARNGFLKGMGSLVMRDLSIKPKPIIPKDESIESFFKRRYGNSNLTDKILSAVMHGIYAGDVSKLSVRSILPSLARYEDKYGSLIKAMFWETRNNKSSSTELSDALKQYEDKLAHGLDLDDLRSKMKKYPMIKLKDGLEVLPKNLGRYIKSLDNMEVLHNCEVKSIDLMNNVIDVEGQELKFDHIHSTINSNNLSELIRNTSDKLKSLLQLEYVSVLLCNVYIKGMSIIPKHKNGFGFLVPKSNKNPEQLLGVIFDSDVEKYSINLSNGQRSNIDGYEKMTLMIGGHFFNVKSKMEEINLDNIEQILSKHFNIDTKDSNIIFRNEMEESSKEITLSDRDILVSYNFISNGIPQFNVGYNEQKENLARALEKETRNFTLGGMSFGDGVGVPDCVMNSLKNALKVC